MDPYQPIIDQEPLRAARPYRRAVFLCLLVLALLGGWIGWRAFLTDIPGTKEGSLSQNTIGFIDLWTTSPAMDAIREALDLSQGQHYAIHSDGSITAVPFDVRDLYTDSSRRPKGWYLPGTIGRLQTASGDIYAIRAYNGRLRVAIPSEGEPLSWIPSSTNYGATYSCTTGLCTQLTASSRTQEALLGVSDLNVHSVGDATLLVAPVEAYDDLRILTTALSAAADIEAVERITADGNQITERRPAQNVLTEEQTRNGRTYLFVGEGEHAWYMARTEASVAASTDIDVLDQVLNGLSTRSLTKRICGLRPSSYINLGSSQILGKNLYVTQSSRALRVCGQ